MSSNIQTVQTAGVTHIGGRENNEDAFSILCGGRLLVVADGMGGHAGGDQASAQAVSSVAALTQPLLNDLADRGEDPSTAIKNLLLEAIEKANSDIAALNGSASGRNRMGTTLTLVYIGRQRLHIAWVGDSRVYLMRQGKLLQLNDDHTLNYELYRLGKMTREELRSETSGRGSNVITRSLGVNRVEPDYMEEPLQEGDIVLACSDGLNNSVSPALLVSHLSKEGKMEELVNELLQEALQAGARDNVTVVASEIPRKCRRRGHWLWSWLGL
ncbi:MAG: serine/threonine-protein phosphatase [Candidatus Melainabacteria bacterium]|nr:serine/threonine-protein phosphatase [Candidatus Melainabacteria bacterium]